MTTSRAAILPHRNDFIHKDYEPPVKGVKMNKGIKYLYGSHSNNIDKAGNGVTLPFLYQAPSVRQGTSVALAHPRAGTTSTGNGTRRKGSRRSKRESTTNTISLPLLPNMPPPLNHYGSENSLSQLMLRGSSKPLNPKASTSSSEAVSTTRFTKTVRLSDDIDKKNDDRRHKTPYGTLRQNGFIVKNSESTPLPLLSVSLPPRAKSANDVREEPESRSPNHLSTTPCVHSLSTQSLRETAERATQTLMFNAVASVEYLDKGKVTTATPYYHRRKSEVPLTSDEIEEKEALMEVIEDALGETFDRYSRQRTSQIIARNARKQAEIWRDAKDFITGMLLPQSIILANKSRRRKQTAAEIVGNIKMYP